jgi:ribonuclease HII
MPVNTPKSTKKSRSTRPRPNYSEESALLGQGYSLIAGLDEAGRGPLAGPVVAGVIILPRSLTGAWVQDIRDSKVMSRRQREEAYLHLEEKALGFQSGAASALEIDELGIVTATRLAMTRALNSLALMPQFLLLDAFPLPGVDIPQSAIIKGDATCLSIAAASVVAKVTRDRMMVELDAQFPGYGFAKHKGYGTGDHMRSLEELGPCPIHRYSFAPIKGTGATR